MDCRRGAGEVREVCRPVSDRSRLPVGAREMTGGRCRLKRDFARADGARIS